MTAAIEVHRVMLQVSELKLEPTASISILISPTQPSIVVETCSYGERIWVQSADRTRLCRASYARDGLPEKPNETNTPPTGP